MLEATILTKEMVGPVEEMSPTTKGMNVEFDGLSDLFEGGNVSPGAIIAVVAISFILTLILFVVLIQSKKAPRNGFLKWLREYLNFRSIMIAGLIKFFYLFFALLTTGFGFVIMFSGKDETFVPGLLVGLAIIIFGNIFLRLILEMTMIMIGIWENSADVRAVLVKDEEKPEEKIEKPKEKSENKAEDKIAEKPQPQPETQEKPEAPEA